MTKIRLTLILNLNQKTRVETLTQNDSGDEFLVGSPETSLGVNPCTTFCSNCGKYVHTSVAFKPGLGVSKGVLKALGSLINCCNAWLQKFKVHECPHCGKVLASMHVGYEE